MACVHVCVYVCVYVCMYVCMYASRKLVFHDVSIRIYAKLGARRQFHLKYTQLHLLAHMFLFLEIAAASLLQPVEAPNPADGPTDSPAPRRYLKMTVLFEVGEWLGMQIVAVC